MKHYEGTGRTREVHVFGFQFGAQFYATFATLEDAMSEFDEQLGERLELTDGALDDYDGETPSERASSAVECGDARYNDGGTLVWVDPYEWVRTYANIEAAAAEFPEILDGGEDARLRCACGALATWKDLDPESGFVARVCCAQHAFDGSVRMNGSEC